MDMSTIITKPVLIPSKTTVKNGDIISLSTDIKGKISGKSLLFYVTYYCDQSVIGTSKDSATSYRYDYLIESLPIGSHKLSSISEYSGVGGVISTASASVAIEVVE